MLDFNILIPLFPWEITQGQRSLVVTYFPLSIQKHKHALLSSAKVYGMDNMYDSVSGALDRKHCYWGLEQRH